MDYEKKYNEALSKCKAYIDDTEKRWSEEFSRATEEVFKEIFPELRESENERIRKLLVALVTVAPTFSALAFTMKDSTDCLAYLEKQKEQKQTDLPAGFYYVDPNGNRYYSKEFRYGDIKLKVGEQKPNYCHHEVDETGWTEEYRKAYYDGWNNCNMQHEQLKADQKPAEWSKESEMYLSQAIETLEHENYSILADKLKSLRPRSSWKPSEEDLEIIPLMIAILKQNFRPDAKFGRSVKHAIPRDCLIARLESLDNHINNL